MNVNIPRLENKDIEPLLHLVHTIETTKSKAVKMALTKLVVTYCQSLSAAGIFISTHKSGEAVEVTSTSWFKR